MECSASGQCRHCRRKGHWSGECPLGWSTAGKSGQELAEVLGTKERLRWRLGRGQESDEKRHQCLAGFLKNDKTIPGGGVPALEPTHQALQTSKDGSARPSNKRETARHGISESYGARGSRQPHFFSSRGRRKRNLSALLRRIHGHVDLHVMSRAARRGQCFTNVLLVTVRTQLADVFFSSGR